MKELLAVMVGSAVGGGLRFLVSKGMTAIITSPFPFGTFTVNILGCLVIGFISSIPATHGWLSPQLRLMLTTGFCGGFTTFSTFMKESDVLFASHMPLTLIAYIGISVILGMLAVWAGNALGSSL